MTIDPVNPSTDFDGFAIWHQEFTAQLIPPPIAFFCINNFPPLIGELRLDLGKHRQFFKKGIFLKIHHGGLKTGEGFCEE